MRRWCGSALGAFAVGRDKPRIVVAEPYEPEALARLRACGAVEVLDAPDPVRLRQAVADADALLVRSYAQVTDDVIEAGRALRVIGRGGVGLENIDLAAARRRGIVVVYTPWAGTRAVAEHTVGLMLAVERRLLAGDQALRQQRFMEFRAAARWRELGGCTLGVVGMGRIGSAVARICALGLGMRVLYNDIVPVGPFDFPAVSVDKPRLYAEADVVSLHVPLTELTRGLIDSAALARFSPTSILINTSRGAVVDGQALAEALRTGKLAGAGLDVFDPEPVAPEHPLLSAPHVILTPHVSGRSVQARRLMNTVVDDVIAVLQGRTPRYPAAEEPG